jgi:hypothetical protein
MMQQSQDAYKPNKNKKNDQKPLGIHQIHRPAIHRRVDFYIQILGLRLSKLTVILTIQLHTISIL